MNISAHSSILTGIINEFNEFLETVKICECNSTDITEFGQKQEIARECFSKECGDDSMKTIFTAFHRLVDRFVLMKENIKNSNKSYALLDASLPKKCSSKFSDLESESHVNSEELNVNIPKSQATLLRSDKSCRFCRKRFATKELLNYHTLQLHEKRIPG